MLEFDPRGSFRAGKPFMSRALTAARLLRQQLPTLGANEITRGYLHQSAAPYGSCDGAYNLVIVLRDGMWAPTLSHAIRDNARSTFSDTYAEHTYHRNFGAVGLAVNGLDTPDASPTNFGKDPLQLHAIETLCAAAAAFSVVYAIDVSGKSTSHDEHDAPYAGEPTWLTHAEAANLPGSPAQYSPYGPAPIGDVERWDLATLVPVPEGVQLTATHASIVGDELRARIRDYKMAIA